MKRLTKLWPVRLGLEIMDTYNRCSVAQAAAALAYFLILTLFPLLMCVNYFIGLFHLDLEQILLSLRQVFPQGVLQVTQDYLGYASQNLSPAVLAAALSTIVISASAGLRALLHTMDRLHGREPAQGVRRLLLSVLLSVALLLSIYLSVVVIFTGDWFFQLLERHLPREVLSLFSLSALSHLWSWFRYLLLLCFMLLVVLVIYWMGTPKNRRGWGLICNALFTAAALVACSVVFSWFIGMSSRYSLLYGSLASLIILLVWLYFCGNILLLGAVVGRVVSRRRPGH